MILREILFWCLIICVLALNVCVWKLRRELKRAKEWRRSHENTENVNAHIHTCNRRKCRIVLRLLMDAAIFATVTIARLKETEDKENLPPAITDAICECYEARERAIESIRMSVDIDEGKFHRWLAKLYNMKIPPRGEKRDTKKEQPIKGNTKGDKERMKAMFEKYGYTYEEKQKEATS